MIKGHAVERVDRMAWEIAVVDTQREFAFTFEWTVHSLKGRDRGTIDYVPTSMVQMDGESMEMIKGLAEAFMKMGVLADTSTTAELKATKYHLEDMRKLTFDPHGKHL